MATTDPLMTAYLAWTMQSEITRTDAYADTGLMLASEFEAQGRPSMAAICESRAKQYKQLAAMIPAIRRVPMGKSFVMLEPMDEQPETEQA